MSAYLYISLSYVQIFLDEIYQMTYVRNFKSVTPKSYDVGHHVLRYQQL